MSHSAPSSQTLSPQAVARVCPDAHVQTPVCGIRARLFTEINTAQPVNIIDLPDMVNEAEKEIINQCAEALRIKYPKMFSPSQNCRLPNVNIDNLRDEIFKSNVVGRLNMDKTDQVRHTI